MVATASPADRLRRADAALAAAVAHLLEAIAGYHTLGRADLAAPLRSAVLAARQAELTRRCGTAAGRDREPTDWFLDD